MGMMVKNPNAPKLQHMARRQSQVGSVRKVADEFGVGKSTVHRAVTVQKAPKLAKPAKVSLKDGFSKGGPAF